LRLSEKRPAFDELGSRNLGLDIDETGEFLGR
jgi:hypothetical protein